MEVAGTWVDGLDDRGNWMILWPLREVVWHGKSCGHQHGCSVITLDENHLITCLEFKPAKTDDGEKT